MEDKNQTRIRGQSQSLKVGPTLVMWDPFSSLFPSVSTQEARQRHIPGRKVSKATVSMVLFLIISQPLNATSPHGSTYLVGVLRFGKLMTTTASLLAPRRRWAELLQWTDVGI